MPEGRGSRLHAVVGMDTQHARISLGIGWIFFYVSAVT